MFPSFPLRSYLDVILGFLYGVMSVILVIKLRNELKKDHPGLDVILMLALYSLSMAIVTFVYVYALSGGLLEEWQRLKFQTGRERAAKILDIGYIQGKSGHVYKYNQEFLEQVDTAYPAENSFPVVLTRNNCGSLFFFANPQR